MIVADRRGRRSARLLIVEADGRMLDLPRAGLATLFDPGDLVVANDAATLPASLRGTIAHRDETIEIRLAGWLSLSDPTRFVAIVFGAGDHRMRTEERPSPPPLSPGARLEFGPLEAVVERLLDHPRLLELRFLGTCAATLAGLAQHGRPIQYAHVPEPLALWDVWTKIAAAPVAFEAPSAGFALDWRTLQAWRRRDVGFATLTHATGISSTGDPALDARLPFDEPYRIPEHVAAQVAQAKFAWPPHHRDRDERGARAGISRWRFDAAPAGSHCLCHWNAIVLSPVTFPHGSTGFWLRPPFSAPSPLHSSGAGSYALLSVFRSSADSITTWPLSSLTRTAIVNSLPLGSSSFAMLASAAWASFWACSRSSISTPVWSMAHSWPS